MNAINSTPDFAWVDGPIADLRQCIADGMSAGETATFISQKYCRVSRNAVIGKANRLTLRFNSGFYAQETVASRRPKPRRARAAQKVTVVYDAGTAPLPPPSFPSLLQTDQIIPAEQRKQLLELTNETCRWGIGDPQQPGFFFCGAPEANFLGHHPYCERHSRTAYNRAPRCDEGAQRSFADAMRLRHRHERLRAHRAAAAS